jgi:hypothetical protein
MDPQPPRPILNYLSPSLLDFVNEGGCAIVSLACPFLIVFVLALLPRNMRFREVAPILFTIGPLSCLLGLWFAYPATKKRCPGYQRVIAWIGIALNGTTLLAYVRLFLL